MFKKISSILGLLIFTLSLGSTALYAQQVVQPEPDVQVINKEVDTNGLFDIEIVPGTQSVINGKVPLIVKFRTETDSNKTEVNWDGPTAIAIETKYDRYFPIVNGQMYEKIAYITPPTKAGRYTIAANITVWQADTNDTSTARIDIEFNEKGQLLPVTDKYKQNQIIKNVVILLILILLIVGAIFGSKVGLVKLKEWLKPPE